MHNGFSTSTTDVNSNVPRIHAPRTSKKRPRVDDGNTYPVTVTKVEPLPPRELTVSAVKAECIAKLGYVPSLA